MKVMQIEFLVLLLVVTYMYYGLKLTWSVCLLFGHPSEKFSSWEGDKDIVNGCDSRGFL